MKNLDLHLIGQECIDSFGKINQLINQVNRLDLITCNKHGSTNKSPTELNEAENKFDTGDLFTNGEKSSRENSTEWI